MEPSAKPLKIDFDMLQLALSDHSGVEWFLDRESGECLSLSPYEGVEEEAEIRVALEQRPDRFAFIVPLPSFYEKNLMAEFADDIKPDELNAHLARALSGRHPFRAFKDVLLDYPEQREAWFQARDQGLRRAALEWLEENGIQPEL
jgi:hypothetical protein